MVEIPLWFPALGGVPWAVAGLGPHLWSLTVAARRGPLGVGARRDYFCLAGSLLLDLGSF